MQSINNTGESIREALGNRGMDSAESMYYFNANRRYGGHFEEEVWQSLLGQPDRVGQVGVPFLQLPWSFENYETYLRVNTANIDPVGYYYTANTIYRGQLQRLDENPGSDLRAPERRWTTAAMDMEQERKRQDEQREKQFEQQMQSFMTQETTRAHGQDLSSFGAEGRTRDMFDIRAPDPSWAEACRKLKAREEAKTKVGDQVAPEERLASCALDLDEIRRKKEQLDVMFEKSKKEFDQHVQRLISQDVAAAALRVDNRTDDTIEIRALGPSSSGAYQEEQVGEEVKQQHEEDPEDPAIEIRALGPSSSGASQEQQVGKEVKDQPEEDPEDPAIEIRVLGPSSAGACQEQHVGEVVKDQPEEDPKDLAIQWANQFLETVDEADELMFNEIQKELEKEKQDEAAQVSEEVSEEDLSETLDHENQDQAIQDPEESNSVVTQDSDKEVDGYRNLTFKVVQVVGTCLAYYFLGYPLESVLNNVTVIFE